MRVVFAGTADFGVPTLSALASEGAVAAVVTQPDRPAGRGRRVRPGPIRSVAGTLGLPILQPERIGGDESVRALDDLAPDLMLVVAYGQILSPRVLAVPRLGCYNLHASLLPALRGAAPINWAILRGFERTGVTVIRMDPGVDMGAIVAQRAIDMDKRETAGELSGRLAALGAEVVVDVLPRIESGAVQPVEQEEAAASLAPKLAKADGAIDWRQPADQLDRFVRGMTPWPGAYSALRRADHPGESLRLTVHGARPTDGTGPPGEVIAADDRDLIVAAGEDALVLDFVQPAGKRIMASGSFVNGYRVAVGDRFLPAEEGRL